MRTNAEQMEDIAKDSREQASAIDEVNVAVRQMDEMTQHNAALVEETNAAIEQTESQASELDRIVEVFTLADSGGATQASQTASRPAPANPLSRNSPVFAACRPRWPRPPSPIFQRAVPRRRHGLERVLIRLQLVTIEKKGAQERPFHSFGVRPLSNLRMPGSRS